MKHKKILAGNIAPENQVSIEEKLIDKGIEFQTVLLHKYKGRIGIFCPRAMDIFVNKNLCKSCPRWLGASGKVYLCKNK